MLASPDAPRQGALDVKWRIIGNFPRASAVALLSVSHPMAGHNLAHGSSEATVLRRWRSDPLVKTSLILFRWRRRSSGPSSTDPIASFSTERGSPGQLSGTLERLSPAVPVYWWGVVPCGTPRPCRSVFRQHRIRGGACPSEVGPDREGDPHVRSTEVSRSSDMAQPDRRRA
jgi:hypothetical protein